MVKDNYSKECFYLKSIKELSEEIGVSTTAIYKKINNNKRDFQPHLKKISNKKYLDTKGIELLKNKFVPTKFEESLKPVGSEVGTADVKPFENHIHTLQTEIQHLKKQLEVKDSQMEKKDQQIDKLQNQSQNYQELLLVKEKQIMTLQEPQENESEVELQQEVKPSLFKWFLGK